MDFRLTKDTVRINEPIFDGSAEHPVESDLILPDYCPDIARILKTESKVCIERKSAEGSMLTVSGTLAVRIIYIPENSGNIRCVNNSVPFTHAFDLREPAVDATVKVRARTQYVNVRPVGPRRVQIRAALHIEARVCMPREEQFVTDCDSAGLEMLKKPVRASVFENTAERAFKVNDELEIGRSKPPVSSIIRCDGHAVVQDYKVVKGKIVAKGELVVRTLYAGDDAANRLQSVEPAVPVSQLLELDGVDEDTQCDVRFNVDDVKVEAESDSDGEERILTLEAALVAEARAFRENEFATVADAYSIDHNVELTTKPVRFEHVASMGRFNELLRLNVDAPEVELTAVGDCTCEPVVRQTALQGKVLVIEGDMHVAVLGSDTAGSPVSVEKTVPFKLQEELAKSDDSMRCDPELEIVSASGTLVGSSRIDLRVECTLEVIVYATRNETVVTDLTVDEENEKEATPRKTLTLYFADEGERLWDIAKRYNTSAEAIRRENSLEDDTLPQRSMLLIPKARTRTHK